MKIIRHGTTRDVLLIGSVALKVPKMGRWQHFLEGLVANMNETAAWKSSLASIADSGLDNPLAPILWSSWGGWVVVMARCERYPCAEVAKAHRSNGATTDHHHMNYGLLKGRVVCLDYA